MGKVEHPLLKEKTELYQNDLWTYIATSGEDIAYAKTHIFSIELGQPLCGVKSIYYEVMPDAVTGVNLDKDTITLKEDTTQSGCMSFREMELPTSGKVCKRCMNKAVKLLKDTPKTEIPIPTYKVGEHAPPLPIINKPTEVPPTNKTTLTKSKLTVEMTKKMKNTWEWAKHYYPDISEREGKNLILNLLHYPINMEVAMNELYDHYKNN